MHSVLKVISLFNRLTATPFSGRANDLIRRGAFKDLVSLKVDPSTYESPAEYLSDAQTVALVRKLRGLKTGIDLKAAALDAFYKAEDDCCKTNKRIAFWVNSRERGFVSDEPAEQRIWDFILQARARIGDVLGPIPRDLDLRFGSGSTYGDRGRMITICHKMASQPTVTPRAVPYLDLVRRTLWWTATPHSPIIVRGNRFTTVPKDSEKDRGIAVEPSVNVALQLAVGSVIKERLRCIGIHIDGKGPLNAQSIHRDLARQGSITGDLATIDLSSASDTICLNLVKLLLPSGWFSLLNDLRSHETQIDGAWVKNHKFSSMGNGFTFELETLIFWALATVITGWAKVYGDDIIIPAKDFDSVTSCLRYFGFTPNSRKSFGTGSFRESCGGDYMKGADVRPVFIKQVPSNPFEWITFHNLMVNACKKLSFSDEETELVSRAIIHNIPTWARKWGPPDLSGCLHTSDRSRWELRCKDGVRYVKALVPVPYRIRLQGFKPGVQLAAALLGAPSTGVPSRDSVSGWKKKWVVTFM